MKNQLKNKVLLGLLISFSISAGTYAGAPVYSGDGEYILTEENAVITVENSDNKDIFGIYAQNGTVKTESPLEQQLKITIDNGVKTNAYDTSGIKAEGNDGLVDITAAGFGIAVNSDKTINYGLIAINGGSINLKSGSDDIGVDVASLNAAELNNIQYGLYTENEGKIDLSGNNINITVGNLANSGTYDALGINNEGDTSLNAAQSIVINTYSSGTTNSTRGGIYNEGTLDITAGKDLIIKSDITSSPDAESSIDIGIRNMQNDTANTNIKVDGLVDIHVSGNGAIGVQTEAGNIDLEGKQGINITARSVSSDSPTQGNDTYGVWNSAQNGTLKLVSDGDVNITVQSEPFEGNDWAIATGVTAIGFGEAANTDISGENISVNVTSNNAMVYGVTAEYSDVSNINLTSKTNNTVYTSVKNNVNVAVHASGGNVKLEAENGGNVIWADYSGDNASAYGIYAEKMKDYSNALTVKGNLSNIVYGKTSGIYADGEKSVVDVTAVNGNNLIAAGSIENEQYLADAVAVDVNGGSQLSITAPENNIYGTAQAAGNGTIINLAGKNTIYSSAVIKDEKDNAQQTDYKVISAVYVKDGATTDINGTNSISAKTSYDNSKERAVWAESGTINITGSTVINASQGSVEQPNSVGIALVAGGREINEINNSAGSEETNNLGYINAKIGANSSVFGDIVAGIDGKVDFSGMIEVDGIRSGVENSTVTGNALAANGGTVNMVLGKGTVWNGRADDYQDVDNEKWHHSDIFAPEFANDVTASGDVNVTLNGAYWNVTGQSWVTNVNSNSGTIDLTNNESGEGNHAIHIGNLEGENTFRVNLSKDGSGNMIYIKDGTTAHQNLDIANKTDVLNSMQVGDEIRFATIANSKGGFGENTKIRDAGIRNVDFDIIYKQISEDEKQKDEEYNNNFNGGNGIGGIGEDKPGTDYVEDNYNIGENSYNAYIVRTGGGDISDGGKTVVNMSKVNYSNAVYMDRLNKRLGEARYINTEEDQGMWVRMRHDRIGKDNEFRIMNTMYELGYDEKQECDNGERRVGAAIDYMDGSSEYTGVGGSGDVSRKGIWLYDTWLGDKGHYSDFVAKWGHLSNDFTLYRGGDKITGDFSNNVYSISAEYGRKKDIGNNWYFEPQVQLQYARVTDANYTTSQGTEVSLDAINSLIARAGFRLGKDLGERSTVYFKADLLHEFLGDQDIYATDGTGTMDVTYGNEGTWCDIGFGFATAMSKTSYAYLDVETSLGNDYEETYQINAGLQWSF